MDYDQLYLQYDHMPYSQRQEAARPCGCPHMAGCHDGSLVGTNIEAISQVPMPPPDINDGQAPRFDDHLMFLESYQSSDSSAYNAEDTRTDGTSASDLSAFSSSEDEGSLHRHQVSKDAAILQQQYGNNELGEQYAEFHNLGSESPENNSGTSPPLFVPLQQNRDLFVDPTQLQNRSAGIEDIQHDRFHRGSPQKRRCLPEQSRTLVPQKRDAIAAKSDEDTRTPLLSSPTLTQTGLLQIPADLKMPQSVDLGWLPPLESRNFHKLAKLGDNFVQDSPERSAHCTRDEWVPQLPVPCLLPFHGNTVEPKPRDPEKPYACVSGCGQTFARKGDWQRHLTLNWLESYWQCPSCDKHFARDRSDKLYGKRQHLETAHRRPGEKPNRERDYHHSISDEKFRKRCGFCGVMSNSFCEFTKHVGAHFRDASANPPFDMRIWRNSWEELATASSGDGGDDDSDDNDDGDENGDGDQNIEDNDYQNQDDSTGDGGGPPSGSDTDKPGGPDYDYGHGPKQDQAPPDYFDNYPPTGFDFMDRADASSSSEIVDDACQDHIESRVVQDHLSERLTNMYLGDDRSLEQRRSLSHASTEYERWRFEKNVNYWTDSPRDKIPSPQEELAGGSIDGVVKQQIEAMRHTRRCQIHDLLKEKYEQTGCRWEVAWIKEDRTEKSLTDRGELPAMDVLVARTSWHSRFRLLWKPYMPASGNTLSSSRHEYMRPSGNTFSPSQHEYMRPSGSTLSPSRHERVVLEDRTYFSKYDYSSEKNDKMVKYKEILDPDPFGNSKLFTSSGKPLDTSLDAPAASNEVAYQAAVAVLKRLAQHPHDHTKKRRAISSGPGAGHDTLLKLANRNVPLVIGPTYLADELSSLICLLHKLRNLSDGLRNTHIPSKYHHDLKPSNILVNQVITLKFTNSSDLSNFRSGTEKGGIRQPDLADTSQDLQNLQLVEIATQYTNPNCGKPGISRQVRVRGRDDAESTALVMLKKGEPTTRFRGEETPTIHQNGTAA